MDLFFSLFATFYSQIWNYTSFNQSINRGKKRKLKWRQAKFFKENSKKSKPCFVISKKCDAALTRLLRSRLSVPMSLVATPLSGPLSLWDWGSISIASTFSFDIKTSDAGWNPVWRRGVGARADRVWSVESASINASPFIAASGGDVCPVGSGLELGRSWRYPLVRFAASSASAYGILLLSILPHKK